MSIQDTDLDNLINHIQNTFRIRENQDPTYVDIAGHLQRVSSAQHQIIFGRRGSGKSCLLVHYHRKQTSVDNVKSIYVDADVHKMLGFPDLLITIVLRILGSIPNPDTSLLYKLKIRKSRLGQQLLGLKKLLDDAQFKEVTQVDENRKGLDTEIGLHAGPASGRLSPSFTSGSN